MSIFFIRHAHALDAEDDITRPLSKKGREQVKSLARFLRGKNLFAPDEIWHSPLVRARETAEQLVDALELRAILMETSGLLPEDHPSRLAQRLSTVEKSIALVGHEPHLSGLASLLVAGAVEPPVFLVKKCAAIAFEGSGRHWAVRWQISPELFA